MRTEHLAFGLDNEIPDNVEVAWGARLIFPDDLVHDRQGVIGREKPGVEEFLEWIDHGNIRKALATARKMAESGKITRTSTDTVILYEDDKGIIKGNPNGSHGYLYVCGYLKEVSHGSETSS